MKVIREEDENSKGFLRGFIGEDFEFADPLDHYRHETTRREAIKVKECS